MPKPCRCLLAEADTDLYQTVREYVAALPAEVRAPEETVSARLKCCEACPHLRSGTCALCGCYVEARAAKRLQRCPDLPDRWLAC